MKRILLVAATTGYQTQMFAQAGERLGIDIVLATDRCHVLEDPWGDRALPIRFEDPERSAAIVSEAGAIDGVVALGDRPAQVAATIAQRIGVRYNSLDSVNACRDKFTAHERFRDAGLLVADFVRVHMSVHANEAAAQATFPCVLKPLGLSASRGVIRANNTVEFVAAFQRINHILHQPEILRAHQDQDRFIQVESYIDGREYALEGILVDGQLRPLALFDKPDPLRGPYFEETIYVTPSRESVQLQQAIIDATQRATFALGLQHGPVHAEMRANERGVWMLEVAARPIGGLCAKVLPGLPELILRHAAGEEVSSLHLDAPAVGVMMIPIPREGVYTSVSGVEAARAVSGIDDVTLTAKQGQALVPLPEGNSYLGFIFAGADNPEAVEAALRRSHAQLEFEILPVLPVL